MGTLTANINKKVSIGGGTYAYFGAFTASSTYATNGETLATAAGERYSLPEKIDFVELGAGLSAAVNGALLKLYGGAAAKARGEELANGTNVATGGTVPFIIYGT